MRAALVAAWLAMSVFPVVAQPHVRVEVHPPSQVNWECKSRWAGNARIRERIVGCAVFTDERGRIVCTLILPRNYSQRLYRHELRTCGGWVHSYP